MILAIGPSWASAVFYALPWSAGKETPFINMLQNDRSSLTTGGLPMSVTDLPGAGCGDSPTPLHQKKTPHLVNACPSSSSDADMESHRCTWARQRFGVENSKTVLDNRQSSPSPNSTADIRKVQ